MKYAYSTSVDDNGKKFWTRIGRVYEGARLFIRLDALPIAGEFYVLEECDADTCGTGVKKNFGVDKDKVYQLLHNAWAQAKDSPNYDKGIFKNLQHEIEKLMEKQNAIKYYY